MKNVKLVLLDLKKVKKDYDDEDFFFLDIM
jgi:hypothetical protein